MSEEFDKEAERERLREKYEADSEGREATERMSQLLLQGATMTNKHCDTCGSPIFRYQDQEFCPTCQAEAQRADGESAAGGANAPTESASEASNAQASATGTNAASQSSQPPSEAATDGSQATATHESVGAASTGTAELGGTTRSQQAAATNQAGTTADANAAAVADSLAETITILSERARQSEDPRQAKTLLEAAREAAETLATLQGR